MAELTISNFKGVNLKESNWKDGFAAYSYGMDFFGLANDPAKISYPGVIQGFLATSAGSQDRKSTRLNSSH